MTCGDEPFTHKWKKGWRLILLDRRDLSAPVYVYMRTGDQVPGAISKHKEIVEIVVVRNYITRHNLEKAGGFGSRGFSIWSGRPTIACRTDVVLTLLVGVRVA